MIGSPINTSTPERSGIQNSVASSTPLRRSSIATQGKALQNEVRNDDDAERSSLVVSHCSIAAFSSESSRSSLDSFTSSPVKEHIQGCLKLYAENKINKNNAWNLRLIDFMPKMLRRHDPRMENLQIASMVVDAAACIYSYRVDGLHHDVLKIAGGLNKAAQAKRGKKDDEVETQQVGSADGCRPVSAKKKRKNRRAIAASPDDLNGDFDVNDCIDPLFERLAAISGNVTSSNRAFNSTLPINDKTLALILSTEDKFLETTEKNISEQLQLVNWIILPSKLLPAFTENDHICEPFHGFSISNWDPNTEDCPNINVGRWVEENCLNLSQQAVAFDINAEVELIPQDDLHNDLLDYEPLSGIESDEVADVAVAACVARVPPAPFTRLTDMRPIAPQDTRLEYSYSSAIMSAWAGPWHWRLKNNKASKPSERTQQAVAGRLAMDGKKSARTKKQLDFMGAGMAFDYLANPTDDFKAVQPNKIMISRKTLSKGKSWKETNYKTLVDRDLDETYFRKLFLKRNVMILRHKDKEPSHRDANNIEETVHTAIPDEYIYNNENDASYCPLTQGEEWGNEDALEAGNVYDHVKEVECDELGDMIEPPTKVAKIFIPYAMRAKRVDMKELKHCTWKLLTGETSAKEKECDKEMSFSTLYSQLSKKLTSGMQETLSVPLALLSVLHLASEKGLVLEQQDDLKDFSIRY